MKELDHLLHSREALGQLAKPLFSLVALVQEEILGLGDFGIEGLEKGPGVGGNSAVVKVLLYDEGECGQVKDGKKIERKKKEERRTERTEEKKKREREEERRKKRRKHLSN